MVEFPEFIKEINPSLVRRYLGYPGSSSEPDKIKSFIFEEIEKGYGLLEPKGGYVVLPIKGKTQNSVSFQELDYSIKSRNVLKLLKEAEKAVLFLVTIGSALEEKVREYLRSGQVTRGFILDAVGSAAVEGLAEKAERFLNELAEKNGYSCSKRFSPGYGDWSLMAQQDIFRLIDAEKFKVSLTESCLMLPEKSITALLGWSKSSSFNQNVFSCKECQFIYKCSKDKRGTRLPALI